VSRYERYSKGKIHQGVSSGSGETGHRGEVVLGEGSRGRPSLAPSTIGNWIKAYQEDKLGEIGKTYRPLTEVEMELAKVKKRIPLLRWRIKS
jgi:hypothetical protein